MPNQIILFEYNELETPLNNQQVNMFLKVQVHILQNELDAMKKIITPNNRRKSCKEVEKYSNLVGLQFPKVFKYIEKDKLWKKMSNLSIMTQCLMIKIENLVQAIYF